MLLPIKSSRQVMQSVCPTAIFQRSCILVYFFPHYTSAELIAARPPSQSSRNTSRDPVHSPMVVLQENWGKKPSVASQMYKLSIPTED